jgi:4-hydroxy-3-methylbut-2-enyl diphosphate reductase
VHNAHELERLSALGVGILNGETDAALSQEAAAMQCVSGSATVVLRAHGSPPGRVAYLKSIGCKIVDATCPFIGKVGAEIAEAAVKGFAPWIAGDKSHPEVVGLLGLAGQAGAVVSSSDDVFKQPPPGRRIALFAQSSLDFDRFTSVRKALLSRFPDSLVRETICPAARERRSGIWEIAAKCDAIVVVGDKKSANSRSLAEEAAKLCRAFFVESAAGLDLSALSGCHTIGLTAGASTPESLIAEVERVLQAV